jgi:two-component system CheB/CheR fusion protein
VLVADGSRTGMPVIFVNDRFTRLTHYGTRDALGRPFDFFAANAADKASLAALESSLALGADDTATLSCKRRDGSIFSGRFSLTAVAGRDGARNVVGVLEDVTEEQLAAGAKLELLAEASQARKEAEKANRVKDVFFASITHELRSPLNACLMWLDVLSLGPQSEKQAKGVDAIKRNLAIQTRLVNDLIDAAKISSGGIEIHCEPLEIETLIEGNLETWRLLGESRGVTFSHHLPDARHVLAVDPERLLQVLSNLLENAFRNTPQGGHVELRLRVEHDAISIEVTDTGRGLNAEDLERVFTPFWRVQAPKRDHKGLGLGLAIAEHVVKGHRGTLKAHSEGLDMGCVFTVRIPFSPARPQPAPGGESVRHAHP